MKEILCGKIVHGKGLGKTVGMPTANLLLDDGGKLEDLKPGVYTSKIKIDGFKGNFSDVLNGEFLALTNIGLRPSVDDSSNITIESFIQDFNADIYEKKVQLTLLEFIRPVKKFNSLEEVKKQVDVDLEKLFALK